ncbi:MAG TPA: DUF2142 domain-containing protein [Acetobacteraceae bacterium]|nr:DUF2142 domain-containing protein [Acetobacteraceae bacterium]
MKIEPFWGMQPFRRLDPSFLSERRWLAVAFLLLSLVTGGQLVLVTPMGQLADEPSHAVRAASLLDGQIIGQKMIVNGTMQAGVYIDQGLYLASLYETLGHNGVVTPQTLALARAIPWASPPVFAQISGSVIYPPLLYLPGIIGIGTGKALGLRPLAVLYTGRLAMLLSYVTMGTLALLLARAGRGVLFYLLMLPMALALGASFNQDGELIALAALAGALLTRDPALHPKSRWIAAALLAILVCTKPPYGLLLFAAGLPIAARNAPRRLIVLGICGLPALAWVALVAHTVLVPHMLPPYHPGPLWHGDPNQTFTAADTHEGLRVLLAAPHLFLTLPLEYMQSQAPGLWAEFVGRLGWLSLDLPHWEYRAWAAALAAALAGAACGTSQDAKPWRASDALFVAVLLTASVIAVHIALYLSWTQVGAAVISGVQGRYFLPLVPFLPLLVPWLPAQLRQLPAWQRGLLLIEAGSILPALLLACYDTHALPALVLARFG